MTDTVWLVLGSMAAAWLSGLALGGVTSLAAHESRRDKARDALIAFSHKVNARYIQLLVIGLGELKGLHPSNDVKEAKRLANLAIDMNPVEADVANIALTRPYDAPQNRRREWIEAWSEAKILAPERILKIAEDYVKEIDELDNVRREHLHKKYDFAKYPATAKRIADLELALSAAMRDEYNRPSWWRPMRKCRVLCRRIRENRRHKAR